MAITTQSVKHFYYTVWFKLPNDGLMMLWDNASDTQVQGILDKDLTQYVITSTKRKIIYDGK